MKTKVIFTILAFSTTLLFSQTKVADKFFKDYAYIKASELYKDAVKKGDSSEHVLTRLGDCYYNNSNTEEAALWYGKAVNKYKKINPEYIFKYIQTLRSLEKFEEANIWLKKYKALQDDERRSDDFASINIELFNQLSSTEGKYIEFANAEFNSKYADFGSYIKNGKIYFASSRDTSNDIYKWNNEPYLDLYQGDVSSSGNNTEISNIEKLRFEGVERKDIHDAVVAITKDGKTMYFTRDNVDKRNRVRYDNDGTTHLKLYKATLIDSVWSNIKELPFNDKVYSTGHPALSPDEKTLYFVSDREGGYGLTDIYSVEIRGGGYSSPKNLGPKINTEGTEVFPFIAKDSTLYFSSNGHINLGLLDVFKSNIIKDSIAEPENLGAPYNSGFDDFAFFIDSDDESGYVSSNRDGGNGSDDIYSFKSFKCKQYIKGVITDKISGLIIPGATVKLIDENGKVLMEEESNEVGAYRFEVDCNKKYTLIASKQDFRDGSDDVETTSEYDYEHEINLELTPLIIDNEIVINPIFFDFNKSNIRPDAAYELENIVTVMKNHPKMIIKIESHTDSRGSFTYNRNLSDRRAKSTRDYIISRGITSNRIESAIGYGESQLLNECADNVRCSEEKHQENRRSKFIIINDYN